MGVRPFIIDRVISTKAVRKLLNVRMISVKGGGLSDNLQVVGRLRVKHEQEWEGNRRMGSGRETVKVRELNVTSRDKEFHQRLYDQYDNVRERSLRNAEEEWQTFREALLRCAMNGG